MQNGNRNEPGFDRHPGGPNRPGTDSLSPEEVARYARHLVLPEIGEEGQRRLRDSSALVVGAGGLGSPLAFYLAAAGVGRIGIVEFDRVHLSNLQRQILYDTGDVDREKLGVAQRRLAAINPLVTVEPVAVRLTAANAREIIARYDVVADGTDNFAARYLVNDTCVLLGKPDVQGSVYRFEGQLTVYDASRGPCYRCVFREPPPPGSVPPCSESGVLGVLPGVIGALQATEVIKLLLGLGTSLSGRLLLFDALRGEFRELAIAKDPECPACGENRSIVAPVDLDGACDLGTGGSPPPPAIAEDVFDPDLLEVTPEQVHRHLERGAPLVLLDVREPIELRICTLPGMTWIPMGQLPARRHELPPDQPIIVYCHLGSRSWQAARYLRAHGLAKSWSLAGGIDSWARRIDSSIRTY